MKEVVTQVRLEQMQAFQEGKGKAWRLRSCFVRGLGSPEVPFSSYQSMIVSVIHQEMSQPVQPQGILLSL